MLAQPRACSRAPLARRPARLSPHHSPHPPTRRASYVLGLRLPRFSGSNNALFYDTSEPQFSAAVIPGTQTSAHGVHDLLLVAGAAHDQGMRPHEYGTPTADLEAWARARWPSAGPVLFAWSYQLFQTAEDLGLYGPDPTVTANKHVFVATGACVRLMRRASWPCSACMCAMCMCAWLLASCAAWPKPAAACQSRRRLRPHHERRHDRRQCDCKPAAGLAVGPAVPQHLLAQVRARTCKSAFADMHAPARAGLQRHALADQTALLARWVCFLTLPLHPPLCIWPSSAASCAASLACPPGRRAISRPPLRCCVCDGCAMHATCRCAAAACACGHAQAAAPPHH